MLTIVSIDPGTAHLAIRIEKRTSTRMETLHWEITSITGPDWSEKLRLLTERLDSLLPHLRKADILIIETQIHDYMTRCEQHIVSYFLLKTKIPVLEVDQNFKNDKLFSHIKRRSEFLKEESEKLAKELLVKYKDDFGLNYIKEMEKKKRRIHDLTDCLVQVEAVILYSDIIKFIIKS